MHIKRVIMHLKRVRYTDNQYSEKDGLIMKQVYDFIKQAGTYYLATSENNVPKVRPFGTIHIYDNGLYIQTGRKKDCYRQIKENPFIEICAFFNGDWIRLSAKAVEDPRIEAEASMLEEYPQLKSMYAAGDGNTVVFRLTETHAVISSFTKKPVDISFD